MTELPAFFQAYATGDSAALSRFEARGVSLTGLGGALTFGSIAGACRYRRAAPPDRLP